MRMLGIDFGTRRLGLALGDTESGIAGPWRVVENEGRTEVAERVFQLAEEEGIAAVVVGVPQTAEGKAVSETAKEVLQFVEDLQKTGLTVHKENEMFSSKVAKAQVKEAGRKEKRDDLAAAAILQSFLDRASRD